MLLALVQACGIETFTERESKKEEIVTCHEEYRMPCACSMFTHIHSKKNRFLNDGGLIPHYSIRRTCEDTRNTREVEE